MTQDWPGGCVSACLLLMMPMTSARYATLLVTAGYSLLLFFTTGMALAGDDSFGGNGPGGVVRGKGGGQAW